MRIMGVDFGDAHTGLSISDLGGVMAFPAGVIHETNYKRTAALVCEKASSNGVSIVVLGWPMTEKGVEGKRAGRTKKFKRELARRFGGEIIQWDERYTTTEATRVLNETDTRGEGRDAVDEIAAAILLQSYLDYRNSHRTP